MNSLINIPYFSYQRFFSFCRDQPFSLYSHKIYSAPPSTNTANETYFDTNTVFKENEIYDRSSDAQSHYSSPHYDTPSNGQPVHHANANSANTNNTQGIANPMYNDGTTRESLYSQSSKIGKQNSLKKPEPEMNPAPDYAELPDLPPREYSGNDIQANPYYNS